VAGRLNDFGLAYLHLIEQRYGGSEGHFTKGRGPVALSSSPDFHGNLIAAGGFEPDTAEAIVARGTLDARCLWAPFHREPRLPQRILEGIQLAKYDRGTSTRLKLMATPTIPPTARQPC